MRAVLTVGEPSGGRTILGQSNVIGVVLLIAIVITISGVAAASVYGLGIVREQPSVAPQVSFTTHASGGDLTIEHRSGAGVATDQLTVTGTSTGEFGVSWGSHGVGDEWTTGEEITIAPDAAGETVRIVWTASGTADSANLLEYGYAG